MNTNLVSKSTQYVPDKIKFDFNIGPSIIEIEKEITIYNYDRHIDNCFHKIKRKLIYINMY